MIPSGIELATLWAGSAGRQPTVSLLAPMFDTSQILISKGAVPSGWKMSGSTFREERYMRPVWREKEQSVLTSTSLRVFERLLYKARINASKSDISMLQDRGCTKKNVVLFLGCSYRAFSVRIVIRLPTDPTLYFVYLFLYFTLHVSGSHKPIIRVVSSCFLYTTIWFMWCLCCSSACACGLVCRGGFTVLVPWWFSCTSGSAEPLVQENHHDKPVHKHTQMSNINTTWTKWLYIKKAAWDTPDDGLMRARNM